MTNIEDFDLVIIRGLPGSGKSTLARAMEERVHFEADMFFMHHGSYQFVLAKIGDAHSWCQNQVKVALAKGEKVVVSNTFTRLREFKPYLDICKKLGKTVKVIEATGNYKNVHDVPEATLATMKARWETYEG